MTPSSSISPGLSSTTRTVVDRAAGQLRREIAAGVWSAGDRLPSIRDLAARLEVSSNSVVAAIGLLEAESLVDRRSRRGVFVRGGGEPAVRPGPLGMYCELVPGGLQADRWGSHVASGCLATLREQDVEHEVLEAPADDPDREKLRKQILARAGDYAGFIVPWAAWSEDTLRDLIEKTGRPIVKVGRHGNACRHNYVSIDHIAAGSLAARQVGDRAPGPFLVLSSAASHDYPRRQLVLGFVDGLQRSRRGVVQVAVLPVEQDSVDGGYDAMAGYLRTAPAPRAVFGIGDAVPIGAMQAALDAGHRVPEEIAFIGSAGLEMAKACRPTLAHVHQPMEQLGLEACSLLNELVRSRRLWSPGRELEVDWHAGGSVAEYAKPGPGA